jgi:hypothetical protein
MQHDGAQETLQTGLAVFQELGGKLGCTISADFGARS